MIDLRREQFLLRDAFKPPVQISGFQPNVEKPDYLGMAIGPHMICDLGMTVDFGD